MKFAIVIPARKNSKSVKNKNRYIINGKPLVEYTLKESFLSKIKLKFIITDDEKIKKISKKYKFNTQYKRPKSTSTDKSSTVETLIHFIKSTKNKYDYDYLIVLQPTSPLRTSKDITNSIKILKKEKSLSLFSICKNTEHPYENIVIKKNNKWKYLFKEAAKFHRRQDYKLNPFFINGAIYIVSKNHLLKKKKIYSSKHSLYIMPKSRSLDINDLDDIEIAKKLL
mgnify:FL=1|tara:strand:- start:120 stop:794 length:675 start_codon:yes stop_codon:yes gene_type:complete